MAARKVSLQQSHTLPPRRKRFRVFKSQRCKAYLRKHGLRISGTKVVCVQRIVEHQRLKDGNGEALYPRSSFVINCTGDVCKGDLVLFTQKVYERFDKMTRHGRVLGKRTVAVGLSKKAMVQPNNNILLRLKCYGAGE
ncbi:hypothetical protein M0R45_004427 [Rubus argutus]|uniref:SAP domain-containing protein n=1 Tax=Rubus argutus TaxID=59490 RepID=A0AAW1YJS8_RUBAR